MNKKKSQLLTVLLLIVFAFPAQATLYDRGNGLIYDDDQNITWMQDANYRFTVFPDNFGQMWFEEASVWVDGLEYAGYDDWRLPYSPECIGLVDCANRSSELAHLFVYSGITLATPGPFEHLQGPGYWTSYQYNPSNAIAFSFGNSSQDTAYINDGLYVWAVRDGDVIANIPVPGTSLMFFLGLAGIGLTSWSKRK